MKIDKHTVSAPASAQAFDARLRQLHAQAVEQLPGRTRLQLQLRARQPAATATRPRRHAWALAATGALCLLVGGLVLRLPVERPAPPSEAPAPAIVATPPPAEAEPASAYAALDESPELYLWLASEDNEPLALE